ncbi:MAG TPA: hypothetical protein VJZ27_11080 [Aggregatilineales bacterium]|nr:hypothetical protein [Aggregatilineales bacterium]
MSKAALCIHAHFYQPPRANPVTGLIGAERSAAPFRNWNERAAEEVYRPNAGLFNFDMLSFDMNHALLLWLHEHSSKAFARILDAVQTNRKSHSAANILAVPLHQSPLPALSRRDRLTQLRWGAAAAKTQFGTTPQGVFLPDFAVDIPTLQSVVDAGFQYTLLYESQVSGIPRRRGGAGPYRISLPGGNHIDVFLVHEELSASMLKEMIERGGAGYWARGELGSYNRHAGALTVLYVDGEMLGQHKMAEAHFLHYLMLSEAPAVAYQPTTLEAYYRTAPKTICEVELIPSEAESETELQKVLYRALDALKHSADMLFEDVLGESAWILRDQAFSGQIPTAYERMIESQVYLQQAYASIAGLVQYIQLGYEHVLRDTAYAIMLIQMETGTDLSIDFVNALPVEMAATFRHICQEMNQQTAV